MKLILSSRTLKSALESLDLPVNTVVSKDDELIIKDFNSRISRISLIPRHDNGRFNQEEVNWGAVKKVVSAVSDRPIVLDISDNKLSITLNF